MEKTNKDITFYLKWLATFVLIIGTAINTQKELYPIGPLVLACGGLIWLAVSIMWKEWSLIITNSILALVGIGGIIIAW